MRRVLPALLAAAALAGCSGDPGTPEPSSTPSPAPSMSLAPDVTEGLRVLEKRDDGGRLVLVVESCPGPTETETCQRAELDVIRDVYDALEPGDMIGYD